MDKRIRSPNYPALSLPEAIEKVTTLYRNQHTHSAPREVVVKSMGYNSLNGASATAISALHKYGLLDKMGGNEVKVSERALSILHPNSPQERREAIREAAAAPDLFAELAERFPGRLPNEEVLRNYLIRKGFAHSALPAVLLAYRKTIEFVEAGDGAYDSQEQTTEESPAMSATTPFNLPQRTRATGAEAIEDERRIGVLDLGPGSYVRIMATPDVDPSEALDWAEEIIAIQRRVLAKRRPSRLAGTDQANAELAESGDGK